MDTLAFFFIITLSLPVIAYFLYRFISIKAGFKYRRALFGRSRITGRSRQVPLNGDLAACYFVIANEHRSRMLNPRYGKNILNACLLRWLLDGNIGIHPHSEAGGQADLSFEREFQPGEQLEKDVLKIIRKASGENRILEYHELPDWLDQDLNFRQLATLPDHAETLGRSWFSKRKWFQGKRSLVPAGRDDARAVIEYRNFLDDLLEGKETHPDTLQFKHYLVYAGLFGFSVPMSRKLDRSFPDAFRMLADSAGTDPETLKATVRLIGDISATAMESADKRQTMYDAEPADIDD